MFPLPPWANDPSIGLAAAAERLRKLRHRLVREVSWSWAGIAVLRFVDGQHSNVLVSRPGIVRRHRVHVPPHRCAWVFLRALQHFAALQAVLGHESIDMTMRYAHLVTDHLHEAVAKAGSRLGTRPSNRERPSEPPQTSTTILPSFTPSWTVTAANRAGTLDIGVGTVGSAEAIVVR